MSAKVQLRKVVTEHFKKNPQINLDSKIIEINPRLLGEGGTAIVYSSVDEKYAVKILIDDISNKESQVFKRFKQEFCNLIRVSEKEENIVKFYSLATIKIINGKEKYTFPFILMKKYKYSLKDYLKENPISKTIELENLFHKLTKLLKVLQNNNIVHRDLKPENVFIEENDDFVLGDFGIAWFDENLYTKEVKTDKNDRLANLSFSAPEQFHPNSKPCYSMDLFALGQILQWSVTKKTIRSFGTQKISDLLGSDAYHFDRLIEQLIQEDPSKRINNLEDLEKIYIEEKNNRYESWLLSNNIDFNLADKLFNLYNNKGNLPSAEQCEEILIQLNGINIGIERQLLFLFTILLKTNESDYIEYDYQIINFEEFINFEDEDIFYPFSVSWDRLSEDGYDFDFNYYHTEDFTAYTDSFLLYNYDENNKKSKSNSIYSEILIKNTNEKYLILIWNDGEFNHRIKKEKNYT